MRTASISNWAVQYDTVFDMPLAAQGVLKYCSDRSLKIGCTVMIPSIVSLDMVSKKLVSSDGTSFDLIGPGKRIVVLSEEEYSEIISDDFDL